MSQPKNISEWIDRVAAQFEAADLYFGHGTDNARDEAAWLVLHATGNPLDGSFGGWGERVSNEAGEVIERLAEERCSGGKPMAYLLGTAFFAGLEFEVNEHVLVPRSPIAELILDHFRPWCDPERVKRVLDMCTGSGCIGIAAAIRMPGTQVDLADISPDALEMARKNISRHGLGTRVRCIESDLFSSIPDSAYDLIVANPPYVPEAALAALPREYRNEPDLGLVSGGDGLDAPLQILLDAPRFLCDYGVLVCEVGESEERLARQLPRVPFTWLEFSHGGSGVFVLTKAELLAAGPSVEKALEMRKHVA
jgi:ribosomal protein L3 glutamine methyltransferase